MAGYITGYLVALYVVPRISKWLSKKFDKADY